MLLAENLLGLSKEVVVIPARNAWPLYNEVHAYICQAGRAFQRVKYIAFYADNQIYPLVPLILEQHDQVNFEQDKYSGRLGELVNQMKDLGEQPYWPYKLTVNKVFLLSAPNAPETVKLKQPVVNDITSGGQRTAFTQNRRYVSLEALRKAKKTSELKDE